MYQIIYRRGKEDWQPEHVYDESDDKDSLFLTAKNLKAAEPNWSVYIENCKTWQIEKRF